MASDVRLVHPIVWVSEAGRFRLSPGGVLEVFERGMWREVDDMSPVREVIAKIKAIMDRPPP